MYSRMSAVLFPVAVIVLVGTFLWGYQVNQEKNAVLIKAENNYQRAFHDLTFHMDSLSEQLGNALAVNSTSQSFHRKCLVNTWRLASEAQNEINQLPLTILPFKQTEEFLSRISNFSYQTAVRNLTTEPITPEEMETLKVLQERSKTITKDLRQVQNEVLEDNLRWMDVELALASENEPMEHSIIQGFETINKQVGEYEEINWGPAMATVFDTKRDFTKLEGEAVNERKVLELTRNYFQLAPDVPMQIAENGKGTRYHTYSVTAQPSNEVNMQMDYTKQGGRLIWFISTKNIERKQLAPEQVVEKAQSFLQKHEYEGMTNVNYTENENTAHLTFARKQDDVVIYPEKLTVKVGLDRGEVLGLQATEYLFNHQQRQLSEPKLSAEAAKSYLNPAFEVVEQQKALIENELKNEVLCYEFFGNINDSSYRIYINADTGIEEKVEQIYRGEA